MGLLLILTRFPSPRTYLGFLLPSDFLLANIEHIPFVVEYINICIRVVHHTTIEELSSEVLRPTIIRLKFILERDTVGDDA